MDPQQRLLLEVAWEALEHAGVNADRLAETRTGVFVGLSSIDYLQLMRDAGLESFDAYTASGAAHSIASGRLSYLLGTRGPSLSIDTACSSSLVAIHQAVQQPATRRIRPRAGRRRQSHPAAGRHHRAFEGAHDGARRPMQGLRLRAPMGSYAAKDAACSCSSGSPMLRPTAIAIVAVIRGSASNQDGRSNGLTAPNGSAQEAVLRAALDDARIEPRDVGFVEAHGTGTSLGDPIEVRALGSSARRSRRVQTVRCSSDR